MSVIIDVGAHNGLAVAIPCSQDLSANVYAIEPNPRWAEHLKSYQRPNLHVFCLAFAEVDGVLPFYVNRNDQTSSLLSATCNADWQRYQQDLERIETINVPVKRLETFIREQQLAEIDLLKIDAQGADLQVLKGAGAALHSVRRIQLEVQLQPLYESSATKQQILDYLSDRGFVLAHSATQTDALEENLEFIRVNRYPLTQPQSNYFEVQVPYVGRLRTPKPDHVGQLLERGSFEGSEQAFLWLYLRAGDTFFDCGTHTGLFSAIAAQRIGQTGKIFGFDPNPVCFDLYQDNLKQLNCQIWMALNVGLSDQDGTATLRLGKPGMSAFSTFADGAIEQVQIGVETVEVTQRSLDSIVQELQISQITLAKLDVEGWEAFVLSGAKQSIQAGVFPVWMIEFTETNAIAAGSSTRELRSLIEHLGYTLCRFDATQLRLIREPPRLQYSYDNLFAVLDLDAVNHRLKTADAEAVAIAKDILVRSDMAFQRDELAHHSDHWRSHYEQLQSQQQSGQIHQALQALQIQNQQLEQQKIHLESELAYLSTGRAALRKLLKGSLRRLGLYRFAYRHHRVFVPVYNFFAGDRWQPATLKNSTLNDKLP